MKGQCSEDKEKKRSNSLNKFTLLYKRTLHNDGEKREKRHGGRQALKSLNQSKVK